ncbi:MAG: phosphohistidine phosphatase SixA [Limnothrix sp.]
MELYLLRHGIAIERSGDRHDAERALTPKGQRRTKQVAQRLRHLGLRVDGIWTSPLLRARQSADILWQVIGGDRPIPLPALAPDGSFTEGLDILKTQQSKNPNAKIIFVGHQPDLSHWAETLLWGKSHQTLHLKKAGIIGIKLSPLSHSIPDHQLFLLTSPKWLL